jgi:hypothetical protein
MSSVDSIIDIDIFASWIGLQTKAANKSLLKQISEWSSDTNRLNTLSKRFQAFKEVIDRKKDFYNDCHKIFSEIADIEKKLQNLINTESKLEKESYNEMLFLSHKILQPLNFVPYLLSIWAFIRVYFLPGISFIIPFLTLLAPYIILKFIFNIPMTFNNYMNILHSMISGNFGKLMDPSSANNQTTGISPINFIKQFGIVGITFIQGIIQPYWTYKHLKSIDSIIHDNGALILRFKQLYEKLQHILDEHGFSFYKCPLPPIYNERDAVASIILNSNYYKLALKYIGSLEVIMCMAHKSDLNSVQWVKSDTPILTAKDTFDFQVPTESRKTISVSFTKNRHALLTGPNKGGKSTVLRALSISALLAHTYGCAPGFVTLTPFSKMFVCLKPDDLPGSKSRFEREVEFTANTLKYEEPILIFIDELYHSTNPPDALRSCTIYCKELWKKPNVISTISTHLFKLVEDADKNIQRLCCPANIDKNGDIHFSYDLKKGICKVSSVDELLKIYGMIPIKCA